KMLLIDLEAGRIVDDREIKDRLARHRPYQKWLDRTQLRLEDIPMPDYVPLPDDAKLLDRQQAFGYTQEELKLIIAPTAASADAEDVVRGGGVNIIILSDREVGQEVIAIPALLALSDVHQHLVRAGLRTRTGLVVETGSAREVHHFALLAGYGAEAIHPNLA